MAPIRRRSPWSQQVLDIGGDGVGLRPDDDLDHRARGENAEGTRRLEARLVDQRCVLDFGAQPGRTGLDLDDIARAPEGGDDLFGLAHGVSSGSAWVYLSSGSVWVTLDRPRGASGLSPSLRASASTISCPGTTSASGATSSGSSGPATVTSTADSNSWSPPIPTVAATPRERRSWASSVIPGTIGPLPGETRTATCPSSTTAIGPCRRSA